jgi:predicted MFS family arabinose efflux permease
MINSSLVTGEFDQMRSSRFLLNSSHAIIDGLFDSIPILLSFIIVSLGAGEREAGMIISLAMMGSTLCGLFTRYLSRRLRLTHIISLIAALYGIGFCANAGAENIFFAGFGIILSISGYGLFHNAAFTYLASTSARQSIGKTIGDFTALGDLGRIPFASLAGFIATGSVWGWPGWRVACLFYGVGSLFFAGWLFVSPRHPPLTSPKSPSPALPFSLLRQRQFALPIMANILDALGSDQVFIFLPYLLFAKDIDANLLGPFAFVFTAGCLGGKIVCGRFADYYGPRKTFIVSEACLAILLLTVMLVQTPLVILGVSLLLGMVTKGTVPVIQSMITEPAPNQDSITEVITLSSFARGMVNILAPLLFGLIASQTHINWIYCIMATFAGCAIVPALKMKAKKSGPRRREPLFNHATDKRLESENRQECRQEHHQQRN